MEAGKVYENCWYPREDSGGTHGTAQPGVCRATQRAQRIGAADLGGGAEDWRKEEGAWWLGSEKEMKCLKRSIEVMYKKDRLHLLGYRETH